MTLLQQLRDAGALRTLDHALAQSLRRLDPATPDTVLAAAALASLAVANGHAGFDPAAPQRLGIQQGVGEIDAVGGRGVNPPIGWTRPSGPTTPTGMLPSKTTCP